MSEGVKRFYRTAEASEADGLFEVRLDGRTARTPGRAPLGAKRRALAEAMAAEWAAQGEILDMARMPLTRLQGQLIDASAAQISGWREIVLNYASTDLLCYRSADAELASEEAAGWQPYLDRVEEMLGTRFALTEGLIAVTQPEAMLGAFGAELDALSAGRVLAVRHMTEISGSAILALCVLYGDAPEDAFAASRLDERYQAARWGEDAEAKAREDALERDFLAAAAFGRLHAQE